VSRFIWTPRQFAAVAAAKAAVYVASGMPEDRIVMEMLDDEAAEPILVVVAHPYAFRRAANEAYAHWGPAAGQRLESRCVPYTELPKNAHALMVVKFDRARPITRDNFPPGPPPLWRVDL